MKFESTKSEGLKVDYQVFFDAAEVEQKIVDEITKKSSKFKMHGFRVGKVPFYIVRQNVEASVIQDVLESLVSEACILIVKSEGKHTLATKPKYNFVNQYEKDKDIEFAVSLEFAPEFELKNIVFELEKIVPNVSDKDVDARLKLIMKNSPFRENAEKEYVVQSGDEVTYKAVCFDSGQKDEKKSFKNTITIQYEIPDDAEYIHGFLGKKIGESFEFSPATEKNLIYKIILKSIKKALRELTEEEYAICAGFKDFNHFIIEIKKSMKVEIEKSAFLYHKDQILEKLIAEYDFELPSSIVEDELKNVIDDVKKDLIKAKADGKINIEKSDEDLCKEYYSVVKKRVLLGYILSRLAKFYGITATDKELNDEIVQEINSQPQLVAQKIIDYYTNNQSAITNKKAEIVEEKIIKYLISHAKTNEVMKTKEEVDVIIEKLLAE